MKCASCYDSCSMNHTRKPALKDFEVFDLEQKVFDIIKKSSQIKIRSSGIPRWIKKPLAPSGQDLIMWVMFI